MSLDTTDPHISNITRWHSQLMTQDIFCKSELEVTESKGISAFKVINIKLIFNFTTNYGGRWELREWGGGGGSPTIAHFYYKIILTCLFVHSLLTCTCTFSDL